MLSRKKSRLPKPGKGRELKPAHERHWLHPPERPAPESRGQGAWEEEVAFAKMSYSASALDALVEFLLKRNR